MTRVSGCDDLRDKEVSNAAENIKKIIDSMTESL